MSRQSVYDLKDGQSVDEVFLLTEKQLRANRNADLYLLASLRDKTGVIHGLMWNVSEEATAGFEAGDYVHVVGKIQLYQGGLQMIMTRIEQVEATTVDVEDFEEDRTEETQQHLERLEELLRELSNQDLAELMACFLDDAALMNTFSRAVAGVKIHHAFRGGLLEHVVTMLEAGNRMAELYPFLDRDLLLAGIFLHDFGKVREIETEGSLRYSDEGQLIGHLVLVLEILQDKLDEFRSRTGREFPDETAMQLKHLVVSHHGTQDAGSPRVPMTLEAIALHGLDNLDAKLNEALGVINSDPNRQSRWTPYQPRLGRKFYKGPLSPADSEMEL